MNKAQKLPKWRARGPADTSGDEAKDWRAVPKMVMGIPEAVDAANSEAPTTLSGRCLGGRQRADAGAVITRGNWKRWETEAT